LDFEVPFFVRSLFRSAFVRRGSNLARQKKSKKSCKTTELWYSPIAGDLFFDKLQTSRQGFPKACDRETAAGCWVGGAGRIAPARFATKSPSALRLQHPASAGSAFLKAIERLGGGITLPMTNLQ
jgi:hypothetical protein